jgi:hypothetical protein
MSYYNCCGIRPKHSDISKRVGEEVKGLHVLGFFDQSYDFSRKSLSKYLMDMIDFNKHDIDIFINLAKIVHYGRH